MTTADSVRAPRLKFLGLAALFAAPIVAATLMYNLGWRPQVSVNSGELVQPPRPVANIGLKTVDGRAFAFRELQRKWTMLYFVDNDCDAACDQALTKMRQAHLAQGKDVERVRRVLIVAAPVPPTRLGTLAQAYPDTLVLTGVRDATAGLAREFTLPAGRPPAAGRVYVVDPIGNFMMSYAADTEAKGMLRDLKRLLKISQIG